MDKIWPGLLALSGGTLVGAFDLSLLVLQLMVLIFCYPMFLVFTVMLILVVFFDLSLTLSKPEICAAAAQRIASAIIE